MRILGFRPIEQAVIQLHYIEIKKPTREKEVKPKVGHKRRLEKIPLFALSSKELSHVVIFS